MKEKRDCLLSVAMIVKDEEHNIRRALESVKDIADEIVVVDTGSKDRTPEIAKEYTDKVYFHKWENDFSEARNFSLKFPICEWVLILDADEEVSENFKRSIREFLKSLSKEVNTVYVPTLSYLDWDFIMKEVASTARIFRNGTVYYKNVVHNQPVYKPKIEKFPYEILHYGYIWTRNLRKKKYERSKKLIIEHLNRINKNKDIDEYIYYLVQLYKVECIGGKPHERKQIGWKVLEEIRRIGRAPLIALEFLFLFGMDIVGIGLFDLAKDIFMIGVNARGDYPDVYFGLLTVYYNLKEYEKAKKWGEKFLKIYNKALQKLESYEWTIMSMKYLQVAYLMMSEVYLREENLEKAEKYLKLAKNEKGIENVEVIVRNIADYLSKEASLSVLKNIEVYLKEFLAFANEKNVKVVWDNLIERLLEYAVNIQVDIPATSSLASLMVKKIKNRSLDFFLEIITSGSKDIYEFLERAGVGGLLLIYSHVKKRKDSIKVIKELKNWERNIENTYTKGVIYALIADEFLKMNNLTEALSFYKKSLEMVPELSPYIKVIVEDLKSGFGGNVEGVYEELKKFFLENKEILLEVNKYIDDEVLKRFYLLSEEDLAKYLSAVTMKNDEKAIKLLESIKNKEDFPYYYYRLAEKYRNVGEYRKSYELFRESVKSNPKLADISGKRFEYSGIYLYDKKQIGEEKDKILWVGNISEKFSTLGAIDPVRMWKINEDGLIYAYPFPSEKAIDIYYERERDFLKKKPIEIGIHVIEELLIETSWHDFCLKGRNVNEQWISYLSINFGTNFNESSRNLIVTGGIEEVVSLKELISVEVDEAILLYFVPSLEDLKDPIWYYPGFRVFRTLGYICKELENLGFKVMKKKLFGNNLKALIVRRHFK